MSFQSDGLNPIVVRMTAVHWAESRVEKGVRSSCCHGMFFFGYTWCLSTHLGELAPELGCR